jgi:ATP-dependent Clp protease, protease subunit
MNLPPELQAALLDRRVVFLRGRLDDAANASVIAQLLLAARVAPDKSIDLLMDSPEGTINAALALYDMLQTLGTPVSTTCTGTVGGAAVLVLAAGAPGQRFALPHARVHLIDAPVDMAPGRGDNLPTQTEEARRATARWRSALLRHTAQDPLQLAADLAAGRWFTAAEAQAYGLIDGLATPR